MRETRYCLEARFGIHFKENISSLRVALAKGCAYVSRMALRKSHYGPKEESIMALHYRGATLSLPCEEPGNIQLLRRVRLQQPKKDKRPD